MNALNVNQDITFPNQERAKNVILHALNAQALQQQIVKNAQMDITVVQIQRFV